MRTLSLTLGLALIWVVRSFLLEVNNTKTQQLAAGVYLQAEQPGGHEPKIASFFVGLDTLVANKPMDAWVELTNAPPTLHLRLARQAGSGDATTLRVSPPPPQDPLGHLENSAVAACGCGQVDVLDAYGDMEEDEIPDSYVKLHMDVAGRTDDKQTEVVNDDMTPSVRTPHRPRQWLVGLTDAVAARCSGTSSSSSTAARSASQPRSRARSGTRTCWARTT